MDEKEKNQIQASKIMKAAVGKFPVWLIAAAVLIVLIAVGFFVLRTAGREEPKPEITITSTLEKIIHESKLSTYTAVYNGIAEVANAKKPERIDYYVSYEATVKAGIDFADVTVSVDETAKTVTITIPEIQITDRNVDMASLEFIFQNKKANTSTVTQEAYKACEADVQRESEQLTAIYDLARQNVENVLKALTLPIVDQMDEKYTLNFD